MIGVKNKKVAQYIEGKKAAFVDRYGLRTAANFVAEAFTSSLGHIGVATYPDRPFLHWRVTFEKDRPGNGKLSDRDNPATYLEGCEKMHGHFTEFARGYYTNSHSVPFDRVHDALDSILRFEGAKEERIAKWREAIETNAIFKAEPEEASVNCDADEWENEKQTFHELASSKDGISKHAYRFHQAAALHRYYVLKELLPKHGVAAY